MDDVAAPPAPFPPLPPEPLALALLAEVVAPDPTVALALLVVPLPVVDPLDPPAPLLSEPPDGATPVEHPSAVASVKSTIPRLDRQRIDLAYHARAARRN